MKVLLAFVAALSVTVGCASFGLVKKAPVESLLIADFNSRPLTNINTAYGAWDKDPSDNSQNCRAGVILLEDTNYVMEIKYDVDSENPAYNGFWMKLGGTDITSYSKLTFDIQSDVCNWKVELKNNKKEVSAVYVNDAYNSFTKKEILLSQFTKLSDFKNMTEFVIVFEDDRISNKVGKLRIDNIKFE